MTAALLNKTCSVDSRARKASAEALMVLRSARSRCRYVSDPADEGAACFTSAMAAHALSSERAPMYTVALWAYSIWMRALPTPVLPPVTM